MKMINEKLSSNQIELLEEIFKNQNSKRSGLIKKILNFDLNLEEKYYVRDLIGKELCDTGFDEDDEPTKRGILLEELIDVINKISV